MLYWATVFFVVALVAALLGFGGIASASAGIAQVLFLLLLFLITLVLASRIGEIDACRRQMLVLTSLEGLSLADAAQVLGLSTADAQRLLAAAKADLRAQRATASLIIEDEPVIALDIAGTVSRDGHRVVGIATTHREAGAIARVPVILITAYPERLLTGERPEPTFLITKPFDPDTLAVSISQALVTVPAWARAAAPEARTR